MVPRKACKGDSGGVYTTTDVGVPLQEEAREELDCLRIDNILFTAGSLKVPPVESQTLGKAYHQNSRKTNNL